MKRNLFIITSLLAFTFSSLAGPQAQYRSSKQANKARSSLFSSLPMQLKSPNSKLTVANLEEDGRVRRKLYFPGVHPLLQLSMSLETDYFTESFRVDYELNGIRQLKVKLPGMFKKKGMMVPLSIRSRRGKARR